MSKNISQKITAILAALVLSQSVLAHNSMTGSEPEADSTVTTAPQTLELQFSDPAWMNEITVTDSEGNDVVGTMEEAASTYSAFSIPLRSEAMSDGEYTVNWTLEGEDTHIITGEFTFTLELKAEATGGLLTEDGSDQ